LAKNGNDDSLAKLLDLKEKYKADCKAVETELSTRHQREEEERKAAITNEYVEKLAALFAERIKSLLLEVLKN
jgi:aminoglycoside phosphotransferase family enzyme